ncbi:MAG: hypothetical protein ACK4VI_09060 [Alphaproteobacteria bacterium]
MTARFYADISLERLTEAASKLGREFAENKDVKYDPDQHLEEGMKRLNAKLLEGIRQLEEDIIASVLDDQDIAPN